MSLLKRLLLGLCFAPLMSCPNPGYLTASEPGVTGFTEEVATDRYGDPLPEGTLLRFGTIRYRHADGINDSTLSPDGKLLATAATPTVAIWDIATGKRVHLLRDFPDCGIPNGFGGIKLAFSPDGRLLAQACEYNFAALIWDVSSGKLLGSVGKRPFKPKGWGQMPMPAAALDPTFDENSHIRFTSDSKQLMILGRSGISVFDAHSGKRLEKVPVPAEPQAVSPDGRLFAAFPDDPARTGRWTVFICALATGKEQARFDVPIVSGSGIRCAFAPDGKTLATTDGAAELRVWEIATGKEKFVFKLPEGSQVLRNRVGFTTVRISPDGKTLFAGTQLQGIRRYDLQSGEEQPPLLGHRFWVTGLHPTEDGKALVSTSWDATIRRWDLFTGKEFPLSDGYVFGATAARSPDDKLVAVGDLGGRLDLWDGHTGKLARSLQTSGSPISGLTFSPNGRILVAGCEDGVFRLWDPLTGKETGSLLIPGERGEAQRFWVTELAFNPDGTRLVAGTREDGLRLWDTATRKLVWSVPAKDTVRAAFSPDGRTLATGGWNARLLFRDASTGAERFGASVIADPNRGGPGFINAIAFAPDGKLVATTHHDGFIRLWDAVDGKLRLKLTGHEDVVFPARFSPDGKWLASGSLDCTVRLWEVATGKEVHKLVGQKAFVKSVEFGRDAKTILSVGQTDGLLWVTRPASVPSGAVAALWDELLSPDAAKAYEAIWALAERPAEASAIFKAKIVQVKPEAPGRLAKLIADLDSDEFAARETATRALTEMGRRAKPALQVATQKPSSPEAAKRIQALLDALGPDLTPAEIREMRALLALELAGTSEARQVLAHLAEGAAGAPLTEDAKGALTRLAKRTAVAP